MFVDQVRCEAGPCGEETGVNGFDPCARNWAETGFVKVSGDVSFVCEFVEIVGLLRRGTGSGWWRCRAKSMYQRPLVLLRWP